MKLKLKHSLSPQLNKHEIKHMFKIKKVWSFCFQSNLLLEFVQQIYSASKALICNLFDKGCLELNQLQIASPAIETVIFRKQQLK